MEATMLIDNRDLVVIPKVPEQEESEPKEDVTDIFSTAFIVLHGRGFADAFDIAKQIEELWYKLESVKTIEDRYNVAAKIVLRYYGRRPTKYDNVPMQESNGRIFVRRMVVKSVPINIEDIKSKTRKREVVMCRQMITFLLHKTAKYTLGQCMTVIHQDHSTLLWACQTVKDLCDTNKDFKANWEKIEKEFKKCM